MVRETRHLWVGNLPENIREERLIDYFKRYGKVQSVRIFPKANAFASGLENINTTNGPNYANTNGGSMVCNGVSATVAFIDIKSAAKAHSSENKIEERTLKTDYYEPHRHHDDHQNLSNNNNNSISSISTPNVSSNCASSTNTNITKSLSTTAPSTTCNNVISPSSCSVSSSTPPVVLASTIVLSSSSICSSSITTGSQSLPINVPASTTSTISGTIISTTSTNSTFAATLSSSSSSSSSSPATSLSSNASLYGRHTPSRFNSIATIQQEISNSTVQVPLSNSHSHSHHHHHHHHHSTPTSSSSTSSYGSGSTLGNSSSSYPGVTLSPQDDRLSLASSNDRDEKPTTTAICVRKLSHHRSTESLKDSLFYEFKRYGKILNTFIRGQGSDRNAIIVFSKPEDVERVIKDYKDKQISISGNRVEISPCDYLDLVDDNNHNKSNDSDDDYEIHPRATRTLYVGNLDKDISKNVLAEKFGQFGEIMEIDIKNQNQPFAFIRYSEISSVVKAMRKYDNEPMRKYENDQKGSTRLKLGFGRSISSNCMWIGDYQDAFSDLKALEKYLNRYGSIKKLLPDHEQKTVLCFYETFDETKKAVEDLQMKMINGRKVKVEFASHDYQTFFIEKKATSKSDGSNDSHRVRSGSWISANSLDYEDRLYDRNRSTSSYHHHNHHNQSMTTSRSSSSISCQVRSSNNNSNSNLSTPSSYSTRQKSQSPMSPLDSNTNSSSSRHNSLSRSSMSHGLSGNGGSNNSSNRSSKYDYHHDSSNSLRSSTSTRPHNSRYNSPTDDLDDVDDDAHLISKRESSNRYRSHHLVEREFINSSPKLRRDTSPYSSSTYSNSCSKLENADFHRSSSSNRSQNEELKSHDDGHGSSRRSNHSKSIYHKTSGRDSPISSHLSSGSASQFKKSSGLSSSSSCSSSSTSSTGRSPIENTKPNSHLTDQSSVSPTSPRLIPYSYHENDRQNSAPNHLSNVTDAQVDHSQWRRKSIDDNVGCHRDHLNTEIPRVRSDSVSNNASEATSSSALNPHHREFNRDYIRDRFRDSSSLSHHRNSVSSSMFSSYQNRSTDSTQSKRKYSFLEDDENLSDVSSIERKKRLMACIDQSSSNSNSGVGVNSSSSGLHYSSTASASSTISSSKNSSSCGEQRNTSSKNKSDSIDLFIKSSSSTSSSTTHKNRDHYANSDSSKRRLSNSNNNGSISSISSIESNHTSSHHHQNPNRESSSNNNVSSSSSNTSSSLNDLKPIFEQYLAEGKFNDKQAHAMLTLLNPNQSDHQQQQTSRSSQVTSNHNLHNLHQSGNRTSSCISSSTTTSTANSLSSSTSYSQTKSKTKDNCHQASSSNHSLRQANNSMVDPRLSCQYYQKFVFSKPFCDNDLSSKSSLSMSSQIVDLALDSGPSSPLNLPLPEFATPQSVCQLKSTAVVASESKSHQTSSEIVITTSITTTTTTTTTSTASLSITTTSSSTNIPSLANTVPNNIAMSVSPKTTNIMSPLGNMSPTHKNRSSRDGRTAISETNLIDSSLSMKKSKSQMNDWDEVSDPDPNNQTIDQKIKALDEKINAWSGVQTNSSTSAKLKSEKTPTIDYSKYNIKKKSQSSNSSSTTISSNNNGTNSITSSFNSNQSNSLFNTQQTNESSGLETADIIKNMLSTKSSVFDQDSKRLEHLNSDKNDHIGLHSFHHHNDPLGSHSKILSRSSSSSMSQNRYQLMGQNPSFNADYLSKTLPNSLSSLSNNSQSTTVSSFSSASFLNTLVSSSTTSSTTSSLYHSNSNQSSSTPLSSTNASNNSLSRKMTDGHRANYSKKEYSASANSIPTTPCSAPVRSSNSGSMFPSFMRSSSIPISSSASIFQSNSSTTVNSQLTLSGVKQDSLSSVTKAASIASLQRKSETSSSTSTDRLHKSSDSSSSNKMQTSKSLDLPPSRSTLNTSSTLLPSQLTKSDSLNSFKKDHSNKPTNMEHSVVNKFRHESTSNSNANRKQQEMERKNSSSSDHNVSHNESSTSTTSTKEHIKNKTSGDSFKYSQKESSSSKDETFSKDKESRKLEKEKSKEKCDNVGNNSVSNFKEKERNKENSKKNPETIQTNKDKEKDRVEKMKKSKDKDHNVSTLNNSNKQSKQSKSNYEKREKSSSNKQKNCEKGKKKDKHKREKKEKSKSINDFIDDEPIYLSMYDKVKARSSANQSLKVAKNSDHQDSMRSKFNQLKDRRQNRKDDDDRKAQNQSDDSEKDSDDESSSNDKDYHKTKKFVKKRRAIYESSDSESSSDDGDADDDGDDENDEEDDDEGDDDDENENERRIVSASSRKKSPKNESKKSKNNSIVLHDSSDSVFESQTRSDKKERKKLPTSGVSNKKNTSANRSIYDDSSDTSMVAVKTSSSTKQRKKSSKNRIKSNIDQSYRPQSSDDDDEDEDDDIFCNSNTKSASNISNFNQRIINQKKKKLKKEKNLSQSSNENCQMEKISNSKEHQHQSKSSFKEHAKIKKKEKIEGKRNPESCTEKMLSSNRSIDKDSKRSSIDKSEFEDDDEIVSKVFSKLAKKKKKRMKSLKEKRSPLKESITKESKGNHQSMKREIFSDSDDDEDLNEVDDSQDACNNDDDGDGELKTSKSAKQSMISKFSDSDTESHTPYPSMLYGKSNPKDVRFNDLKRFEKLHHSINKIKHQNMNNEKRINSKSKKSSLTAQSIDDLEKYFDDHNSDSTKENVIKKKKKSSKNRLREKIRRESTSTDSDKMCHLLQDQLKFKDFKSFSLSPNDQHILDHHHRRSTNLLDPKLSGHLLSPPPKTPEISSSPMSPSYGENIIISQVDDDNSYIDSKIDEDLINESQTILRHCNESSSSDSCLSDSLSHPTSPTGLKEFSSIFTSSLGPPPLPPLSSLCSEKPSIDSVVLELSRSPLKSSYERNDFDDDITLHSRKFPKNLDEKHPLHPLTFQQFKSTAEKPEIEKLSFKSPPPISTKSEGDFSSENVAVDDKSVYSAAETKGLDINVDLECQRKIEDDLAVAALLQDMNDPCIIEETTIQPEELEVTQTDHEIPLSGFIKIISDDESVIHTEIPIEVVTPITVTDATTGEVIVDDQELKAAVQEIELVGQDTKDVMKSSGLTQQPTLAVIETETIYDDDTNLQESNHNNLHPQPISTIEIKSDLESDSLLSPQLLSKHRSSNSSIEDVQTDIVVEVDSNTSVVFTHEPSGSLSINNQADDIFAHSNVVTLEIPKDSIENVLISPHQKFDQIIEIGVEEIKKTDKECEQNVQEESSMLVEEKANQKRTHDDPENDSSEQASKPKRGRKTKARKNSESPIHSPRSESGNVSGGESSASLSINTNTSLMNSSPSLLSPTSLQSYSDISPGSKKSKQIQQQSFNYGVRRSARSAINCTTIEELDETDCSFDDLASNKDEHDDESKNSGKKQAKRGRKKKNSGNSSTCSDSSIKLSDDNAKKILLTPSSINTNRPKSSTSPYDVFEFTDDEDEMPLSLDHIKPPHFMSSSASSTSNLSEDNHHLERKLPSQHYEPENLIVTTEIQPSLGKNENASPTNIVISGDALSQLVPREYVSEVNQSGKLVIRLQDSGVETKGKEDQKSIDDNLNDIATSAKGIRKSARLMSQGVRAFGMEEFGDDNISSTVKKVHQEQSDIKTSTALTKRVTRSYRKSEDHQSVNESSDELDEIKNSSSRSSIHRVATRSNRSTISTDSFDLKKNESEINDSDIDQQESKEKNDKSSEMQVDQKTLQQNDTEAIEECSENNIKPESSMTSVIQSTGNVEKITNIGVKSQSPEPSNSSAVSISSSIAISTTSQASFTVITNAPVTQMISSITTSPTSSYLQDIPNISERIHHSTTPLKLKTGKGLIFDDFKVPIHVLSSVDEHLSQKPIAENESAQSVSVANLKTSNFPAQPNQTVTIKPKFQHPVGQQAAEIQQATNKSFTVGSSPATSPNLSASSDSKHTESVGLIHSPKFPASILNDSIKNSTISANNPSAIDKNFALNKSVLQIPTSVSDPPIVSSLTNLPSTNPETYHSQELLNALQKQQLLSNQQRPQTKSDHILDNVTSANQIDNHSSDYLINHTISNHPTMVSPFTSTRPPSVSSANPILNQSISIPTYDMDAIRNQHLIWSTYANQQGPRQIPLPPRFMLNPSGFSCLTPGLTPEQIEQAQQKVVQQLAADKSQKDLHLMSLNDESKHTTAGQDPQLPIDMASGRRNFNTANLRHLNPMINPHEAVYLQQLGLNGQNRNLNMPPFVPMPNPELLAKQLIQSPSPTLEVKRPASKPNLPNESMFIPQRSLPSPAHSPAFRKEAIPEHPSVEMLRNQMQQSQLLSNSPPLNMSFQRVNSPGNASRPSSRASMGDQNISLIKRTPITPSNIGDQSAQLIPSSILNSNPTPVQSQPTPSQQQQINQSQQAFNILQRHPIIWNGLLALKNDQAAVQMHYVSGNQSIAKQALPFHETTTNAASLRITQRMRIEPNQLQGLVRKIQSEDDYCILMALPCGRDQVDVLTQSNNLKKYFITYLQSKYAAGIVNDSTFGYITHIFPPCDFSEEHLLRTAPEMLHSSPGISHLMVVITTTSTMNPGINPSFN